MEANVDPGSAEQLMQIHITGFRIVCQQLANCVYNHDKLSCLNAALFCRFLHLLGFAELRQPDVGNLNKLMDCKVMK